MTLLEFFIVLALVPFVIQGALLVACLALLIGAWVVKTIDSLLGGGHGP